MKRTPEREKRVLDAIRSGNTLRAAAHYGDIDESTLWRWAKQSATFAMAIQKAEADAEVRHVANIAKAAQDGTWQASAWWLERRRPDDYARRERIEQEITAQAPVHVTVTFDHPAHLTDPAEQPLELDDDRLQPATSGRDFSKGNGFSKGNSRLNPASFLAR